MPRAIPLPVRQSVWRRHQRGQDSATIARELGLNPRSVRRLLARLRRHGEQALAHAYHRCRPAPDPALAPRLQEALALRQQHPTWGAGLIRVVLARRHPQARLPSERTLRRCFRRQRLSPAPAGRPAAAARAGRALAPHDTWQMDAADQVALRGGRLVSWLRLVDECSGAVLLTAVFPPGPLAAGAAGGRAGPAA